MDLLHAESLPGLVAVGSADADFAPLVVRLREAGMRVICFAQRKKAADGLNRFYDDVIFVDEPAASRERAAAPARKTARKAAAPRAQRAPAPVPPPAPPDGDQVQPGQPANKPRSARRARR